MIALLKGAWWEVGIRRDGGGRPGGGLQRWAQSMSLTVRMRLVGEIEVGLAVVGTAQLAEVGSNTGAAIRLRPTNRGSVKTSPR